jgi:hypothetical protein
MLPLALFASALAHPHLTERFHTVRENGVWWLRDQADRNVFSLGVCVVDPGYSWDEYDPNNLAYAGFRFYPNRAIWAKDTVSRLTDWGFNTIGAWSDYGNLLAAPNNNLYMTPILHMGSGAAAPWVDMWDPKVVDLMDAIAKAGIEPRKRDSRIIGYFSDNEQGWWKGSIFKLVWEHKTHGTRARAIRILRKQYGDDWSKLTADFEPEDASSFTDLEAKGKLWLRPGGHGSIAAGKILGMIAERYYSLCTQIIKKYDPDALYLGDRYISNYYPEVAEQAGRYCDVVSTNLNPDWKDGGFVHFHLDSLEALTHKPLMVTEYYMTAKENRTGDPNSSSDFPVVQTQADRAKGFINTTKLIAQNPALVGAHWFQYYDEPQHGRGDGENYDFGLVDANNRPYEELTDAARHLDIGNIHSKAANPAISEVVPPAPSDPYDMTAWDRDRAYAPAADSISRGDLYCSWTPDGLRVNLFWHEDLQSESFYKDGKIPLADHSVIEIAAGTAKPWKIRIDQNGGTQLDGPDWSFRVHSNTSTHQSLSVQIPSLAFRMGPLIAGSAIRFSATLYSETKAYTTHWNVQRTLAN